MKTTISSPEIIVLADGKTQGEVSHRKGHLFEEFMANLLALHGYINPRSGNLNVTQSGIEIDIAVETRISKQPAIAECKAYASPLDAKTVTNFYGKLSAARLEFPETVGMLVVTPGLNGPAHEKAKSISSRDPSFVILQASDIWDLLKESGQLNTIKDAPNRSDPAVIVHSDGIFAAAIETDPSDGRPNRVLLSPKEVHSEAARDLLSKHAYSQGLVVDWTDVRTLRNDDDIQSIPTIAKVRGSSSDFEYQYPASPRFFVGRSKPMQTVKAALESHRVIVLNAQSGWGKSSLALKIAESVRNSNGYSAVFDSRTASTGRYIPEVLRMVAEEAQTSGVLTLPSDATWASTKSAVDSMARANWASAERTALAFFDQFENVFQSADLTREFRDLVLLVQEAGTPLTIGFAWKTDYVGWAEDHPYALRDQIRERAKVVSLEPFGSREVEVILSRLQKSADQKLSRELRTRLREHSAGLPWLLKKLSGHVISELESGTSQESLVSEGLNVRALFEADLAELSPTEQDALRHVALQAPLAAGDALERFDAATMQSLLDRRLLVQVGSKFDTYWDIFRDYVVTGRVPIEDTYILRQNTGSVSKLITQTTAHGGDVSVPELARLGNTSENVVFNVARDMRLLGLCTFASNRVSLAPEIRNAEDMEAAVKARVQAALRRHRAYRAFVENVSESDSAMDSKEFSELLPDIFPAVEVTPKTWATYAQIFLNWFQYAALAEPRGSGVGMPSAHWQGRGSLTSTRRAEHRYGAPRFPSASPGVSLRLLESSSKAWLSESAITTKGMRRAAADLVSIGALRQEVGGYRVREGLTDSRGVVPESLLSLLRRAPGGQDAIVLLESDPRASQTSLGKKIMEAYRVEWKESTMEQVGKFFRGYARAAGMDTGVTARRTQRVSSSDQAALDV